LASREERRETKTTKQHKPQNERKGMNDPTTNEGRKVTGMNRKEFFKTAGLGSIAAATGFLGSMAPSAFAEGGTPVGFRFVSNSRTATVGGVRHLAQFNGDGLVTGAQAVASGSFNHVIDTSPVPKTIVASGTWKARSLIGLELIGTYGAIAAGILEMEIDLVPSGGPVIPATLEVVCNLGAAGLFTGEEEGFVLSIPGTDFVPGGAFGPFMPFVPVAGGPTSGLSVFNLLVEQRH